MASLRLWLSAVTALLVASASLAAPAVHTKRQSITSVSQSQIDSYTPSAWYAAAGYCEASATLAWNCGTNCQGNPSFKPIASGGDGSDVQFWFVGYDPTLQTVVVSIQGTKPSAIIPLITDGDIELVNLDSTLFPGLDSSIEAHKGFADAHADSATDVLAAVQQTMSLFNTSDVLVTGHSLGAAISLLHSVYIPLHVPSAKVTFVGYGLPRVGNQQFADYVDAHDAITSVTHINNKEDPIPILPGRFLGFHHPSGEIHIQDSGAWLACPGQDNTDSECIVGDVSSIFDGDESDHDGPYNGVDMNC
ncbi:lipase [Dichomitus squalens]|uniref:Lipase n=1 Tax=Dichomitus squalens TaxID=114155 RepID=A0A4Q9MAH5_9APHY|nr:lipase [Dichomitus squalens LYAD-421 SS1]EJF64333.1 lipase [Dichomitus squalens LYAD-421 SS1]TBU24204.1 lipase [Dichomitus squalens]TBU44659.1 lipase [Dichomitus squalens]TBU59534.1 lipase [Dichomitus squalens]